MVCTLLLYKSSTDDFWVRIFKVLYFKQNERVVSFHNLIQPMTDKVSWFFSIIYHCILKIIFNITCGLNYTISSIYTLPTGLNISILFILLNLDILQEYLNMLWRSTTPDVICFKGCFNIACHLSSGLYCD